jgi:hypothetical protein
MKIETEIIHDSEMYAPPAPKLSKARIDEPISRIVGKTIYATDPRLLRLIIKWKKAKPGGDEQYDYFLRNPEFIKELKATF